MPVAAIFGRSVVASAREQRGMTQCDEQQHSSAPAAASRAPSRRTALPSAAPPPCVTKCMAVRKCVFGRGARHPTSVRGSLPAQCRTVAGCSAERVLPWLMSYFTSRCSCVPLESEFGRLLRIDTFTYFPVFEIYTSSNVDVLLKVVVNTR